MWLLLHQTGWGRAEGDSWPGQGGDPEWGLEERAWREECCRAGGQDAPNPEPRCSVLWGHSCWGAG